VELSIICWLPPRACDRELSWIHSRFAQTNTGGIACAHSHSFSKSFNAKFSRRFSIIQNLQFAERLRVAACRESIWLYWDCRPDERETSPKSCDFESNLVTVILFYECQRQVHPSRNTCRRINRPISQINPIRLNYDGRILPRKLVAVGPNG